MIGIFEFQIGNAKHRIGSKLFPITDRRRIRVFAAENTSEINIPALAKKLDRIRYESGFCYTNSSYVLRAGVSLALPVEFYAGWLFIGREYPIHHAWVVLCDSVIDMGFSRREMELLRQVDYSKPSWREKVAPEILRLERMNLSPTTDRIFGKVPGQMIYVGCPDNAENARRAFRILVSRYPGHPSYRGTSLSRGSKLQQVLGSIRSSGAV